MEAQKKQPEPLSSLSRHEPGPRTTDGPAGDARHDANLIRGLIAISPALADDAALAESCDAALAGGARILQYRDKGAADVDCLPRARMLADLCRRRGALFIVNDSPRLAAQAGADGAHVGRQDAAIGQARAILGANKIVGTTCHDSLRRARAAVAAGASYCAFGAVFSSQTKPEATPCSLSRLREARREISAPIVAIGGITADNARQALDAGADAVAVCAGLFGPPGASPTAEAVRAAAEAIATACAARTRR